MKHNVYFNGSVQSLGPDGEHPEFTVGVVEPGEYDFGTAPRRGVIHVLQGTLWINGQMHIGPHQSCLGSACRIEKGQPIKVLATTIAGYLCRYED